MHLTNFFVRALCALNELLPLRGAHRNEAPDAISSSRL